MKTTYETQDPVKVINEKIKKGYTLTGIESWGIKVNNKRNYLVSFEKPNACRHNWKNFMARNMYRCSKCKMQKIYWGGKCYYYYKFNKQQAFRIVKISK